MYSTLSVFLRDEHGVSREYGLLMSLERLTVVIFSSG
jgi:Flp pilus assembly pilin Flp